MTARIIGRACRARAHAQCALTIFLPVYHTEAACLEREQRASRAWTTLHNIYTSPCRRPARTAQFLRDLRIDNARR